MWRISRLLPSSTLPRAGPLAVGAVLLLAVGLRLGWSAFSEARPTFEDDSGFYYSLATSLSKGEGYKSPLGFVTAYLPPAYPFAVSGALKLGGDRLFAAQALNAVLGGAAVLALYILARGAMSPGLALLSALLLALLPSHIISTAVLFPDGLLLLLVLLGLAAYARALQPGAGVPWAFLAGLALGCGALTRPQLALFPLALVAHAWATGLSRRRLVGVGGGLLAGLLLLVLPWMVRNVIEVGHPGPISTNGGVAFWIGHHAGAAGDIERPAGLLARFEDETDPVVVERRANSEGFRLGLSYMARHPLAEAANLPKKLFWFLADDEEWMELNDSHGVHPFLSLMVRDYPFTACNSYYYALLVVGGLGMLLTWPLRNAVLSASALFALYWVAVHLAFYGDPRFHAMLMPVLALFAAHAMGALWHVRGAASAGSADPRRQP